MRVHTRCCLSFSRGDDYRKGQHLGPPVHKRKDIQHPQAEGGFQGDARALLLTSCPLGWAEQVFGK